MLRLVILRCPQRIAEIEKQVDFVIGNAGGKLFNTAAAAGEHTFDRKSRRIGNIFSGRFGRIKIVLGKNSLIGHAEFRHKLFFSV